MRYFIELLEQADFAVLLETTARVAFLLKTYGAKLEAKFNAEPEPADIAAGVNMMSGETLPEKLVAYLLSVDPTKNQQYGQWLVVRYLKNALKLEDLPRADDALEKFEAMKQARTLPAGTTDINTIKSLADLFQIVRGAETAIISADDAEQQTMAAQSKLLYDGPDCKILIPLTQAAACFFGANTEWCTAWGDHQQLGLKNQGRHPGRSNRYSSYADTGPLYIITLKGARHGQDVALQYHSETTSFMDVDDRPVSTEYVRNLLKTYPMILKTIGEATFAASHLEQLGISFFSPRALTKIDPNILSGAVRTRADFDALPDALKTTDFIAGMMFRKGSKARIESIIPQTYFTTALATALRVLIQDRNIQAWDDRWSLFEFFPVADWPAPTIEKATMEGRMGYDQFMQLPEDQRTPEKLHAFIWGIVRSNPKRLNEFPEGFIADAGLTQAIVKHVPGNLQYLHDADVSDDDVLALVAGWQHGSGVPNELAYLPPHRLVDPLLSRINSQFGLTIPPGEAGNAMFRTMWAERAAGLIENLGTMYHQDRVPKRFRDEAAFWEAVMRAKVGDTRRVSRESRDRWLRLFFENIKPEHITPGMLDLLVTSYVSESDRGHYWRTKLLALRRLWSETMIRTALKRKFLKPHDITEDEITPPVAALLFRLDPTRQALAYQADDASLAHEIDNSSYLDKLIDHIPADRITEPVGYAAIKKAAVPTAKKRFPKAALSKRVYYQGVPYTFDLKDVPKKWRDDAMTVKAVSRDPNQLRSVPEPLAWLNAHPTIADDATPGFSGSLERAGYVAVKTGFARITDLPVEPLIGGYVLYRAEQPKKIARWFLCKGETIVAKMEIKNGKLRLDNESPAKDLEPVLRDIAKRFLTQVSDISILNKVGIYRDRDGSLREPSAERASQMKKLIDGIEWSQTAHLKGKLHTAWKDDTAILTVYVAPSGGWGGRWPKVQKIEILDQPLGLANNAALQKGFADVISRHPENGRWDLMNIGIGYKEKWGFWIMTEQKMDKVGPFQVFYSPSQRVISIFGNKGLAAYCGLLVSGKPVREQVYDWIYPKDAGLLAPALAATAAKIGPAKKQAVPAARRRG